eukprot:6185032-Pleurochrysis_carterae.AAC.1
MPGMHNTFGLTSDMRRACQLQAHKRYQEPSFSQENLFVPNEVFRCYTGSSSAVVALSLPAGTLQNCTYHYTRSFEAKSMSQIRSRFMASWRLEFVQSTYRVGQKSPKAAGGALVLSCRLTMACLPGLCRSDSPYMGDRT